MGVVGKSIAALGLGIALSMPSMGQQYAPRFERPAPEYDGLGRKKPKPLGGPIHGAKKRTRAWREYAARVVETHSYNEDPRDDKYLHASQRWARNLRRALGAR